MNCRYEIQMQTNTPQAAGNQHPDASMNEAARVPMILNERAQQGRTGQQCNALGQAISSIFTGWIPLDDSNDP